MHRPPSCFMSLCTLRPGCCFSRSMNRSACHPSPPFTHTHQTKQECVWPLYFPTASSLPHPAPRSGRRHPPIPFSHSIAQRQLLANTIPCCSICQCDLDLLFFRPDCPLFCVFTYLYQSSGTARSRFILLSSQRQPLGTATTNRYRMGPRYSPSYTSSLALACIRLCW